MQCQNLLFKIWYYFRAGYSFYFAVAVSGLNALMILYFVVGDPDKVEWIRELFPHFLWFVLFAVVVGAPILIATGWFHYKRQAYKSETSILFENNPYMFKLIGHQKIAFEVFNEFVNELIENEPLDSERLLRLNKLRTTINRLLDGGTL